MRSQSIALLIAVSLLLIIGAIALYSPFSQASDSLDKAPIAKLVSEEVEGERSTGGDPGPRRDQGSATRPPEDKTLRLTVPEMERVEDIAVPDAAGGDGGKLRQGAIHLRGTGFPWQEEANVYIAGHRLGYSATGSFLLFRDLGELEDGDEVFVEDANGRRYAYEVFEKFAADPTDVHVIEPEKGKNIISLQSCTLPDHSERLIVRAELVEKG